MLDVNFKINEQDIVNKWHNVIHGPVVSICCITYNQAAYIQNAIDSFLLQKTVFPFEILIHDDASSDGTRDILVAYSKKYPRIIKLVLQSENQFSSCRLIAPRFLYPISKGKYVALCEGDDYWVDDTKLQKQVDFLENNQDYVVTYSDCEPFDETGKLDADFGAIKKDIGALGLKKAPAINTLTACFRNVIKEVPQELMSAQHGDLVLWSLLGHYGKGKYMPEIQPSAYRVHDGGIHSKKDKREKLEMALITHFALYTYYKRTHDEVLSKYYKVQICKISLLVMDFSGLAKTVNGLFFELLIMINSFLPYRLRCKLRNWYCNISNN